MGENPIGRNIRSLRNARHWTQEELATASGVDVRTIQRAEAGRPLALESLKAIAAVFDTTIGGLSISQEELHRHLEDFRKKYALIEIQPVGADTDLNSLLSGSDALQIQRIGGLSDEQADDVANLEQELRDCLDIWGDVEPIQRRELEKHLRKVVASLSSQGVSVSIGSEVRNLRFQDGSPWRMSVLHVAVAAGRPGLRMLVREKGLPISFA